ncbi:MAG: pilus assembly protein PilM [bacterium]|nr:pilus assembly protein PilM [bacterium]
MNSALYRLFTPPKFLTMPAAGIEIGDAFVRAISFAGSIGFLKVSWWQEEALPHGAVSGGIINDRGVVVDTLRKIRVAHGFSFAHLSIPEQQSYLCEIQAPTVSPEEARAAIELHLEEQVPIRVNDAVFDAVANERVHTIAGAHRSYRVAAAQKKIVEAYSLVCNEAGIAPLSFDIEACSVARAVVGARDARSLLILNMSEDDTGLYVVDGGVVRFASTVPLVLGEKVAEEITHALAGEVARVREFWETHGDAHEKIHEVVVCGRGSAFPHNLSALSSVLNLPVLPASVWQNAFAVDEAVPPIPRDESLRFAVPIGLALRPFIYV